MPEAASIPEHIGRYRVLAELGEGGMGTIYLARSEGPGGFERLLALKMLLPHLAKNRHFVDMFLDEARITAMIHHPNVVQTFEVGEDGGRYFIAMDYVLGETLAALLTRTWRAGRPIAAELGAYVVACAADGLEAAHSLEDREGNPKGVVHRDVSPQNILVGYDGSVRVVDFGVAKAADRLTHTGTGVRKGKAAYMAPEHVRTEEIDRRADVFGLGVVLWESTIGKRLFKAHNEAATIDRVMRKPIPPPSRFRPGYPARLEGIALRALARDRTERYQTAAQMADDLRGFLSFGQYSVGPTPLSELMAEAFPDRLEAKIEVARMAEIGAAIPALREDESSASLSRVPSFDDEFLDLVEPSDSGGGGPTPSISLDASIQVLRPSLLDRAGKTGVLIGAFGVAVAIAAILWSGREVAPVTVPIVVERPADPPPAVLAPPVAETALPKAKAPKKKRRRGGALFGPEDL